MKRIILVLFFTLSSLILLAQNKRSFSGERQNNVMWFFALLVATFAVVFVIIKYCRWDNKS
ncbi:MAG TPA: hypothetical protein VG694_00295 [Candidatus Paceibacterota bacterium]|nr:hypothetical protein [Candidatus Paceibacterota bacterium]